MGCNIRSCSYNTPRGPAPCSRLSEQLVNNIYIKHHIQMDLPSNFTMPTILTSLGNSTDQTNPPTTQNWEFLVAVLATALSVSLLLAGLAKCQVVRRYLASYRHTRLRDGDNISQCGPSSQDVEFSMHGGYGINPHAVPQMHEEDDDGFIEDNYIQSCEREQEECGADDNDEEEMDEIQFSIT